LIHRPIVFSVALVCSTAIDDNPINTVMLTAHA
jgi:hypothetical protein